MTVDRRKFLTSAGGVAAISRYFHVLERRGAIGVHGLGHLAGRRVDTAQRSR